VVIEERRLRIEDNPNAKVIESLNLISFDKKGAYHKLGTEKDKL
jgi:zinc protease